MIPTSSKGSRRRSRASTARIFSILAVVTMAIGLLRPLAQAPSTYAASVSSSAFTGGAGTVTVSSTLYAKQGGALTLNVTTDNTTKCVDVSGAFTGHLQSNTAKISWSFGPFTAPAGDGVQSVSVVANASF